MREPDAEIRRPVGSGSAGNVPPRACGRVYEAPVPNTWRMGRSPPSKQRIPT
jgi:hypothetical protein